MPLRTTELRQGIEWLDVHDPTAAEMKELSERFGLNHHIVRDCMDPDHLPKYEQVKGVHFLILRFFKHQFEKQIGTVQDLTSKVAIFFNDHFILTIHRVEFQPINTLRTGYVEAGECAAPVELVIRLIWHALESFSNPAERLSEQLDFYENQILLKGSARSHVENLYYIKRQASLSLKVLMLMQEPINHIRPSPAEEGSLQDVRDQYLKLHTIYQQLQEEVNNLMGLYLSFSSLRTNDIMKVLTVFSVFFMPLTFVAGIYGMNFEHMPELSLRWGYPVILLVMLLLSFGLYLWIKHKHWL